MTIDDSTKKSIIEDLNEKLGSDLNNLDSIYTLQSQALTRKHELEKSLSLASDEAPSKISAALNKSDDASQKIKTYEENLRDSSNNIKEFLLTVEPVNNHLNELVAKLKKLEATKEYLESIEMVKNISQDLKTCVDSEQSILLMQQLYELHKKYKAGHRGEYISEMTHYWYNVLRDKLSKEFNEILLLVRWPITSTTISLASTPSPESYDKFKQIVQYLFQIQMPDTSNLSLDTQQGIEQQLCLPIRLMLVPLKKRFSYHFCENRRTDRSDRPEWFLTQILSWLRDHLPFLNKHLQPIADALDMKINVSIEFTCGLVQLAVDRVHALLSSIIENDSLFSHAVDECLGFDRELENTIGFTLPIICPRVTTVLTNAKYMVHWLAVEKKYAIQKINELLVGNNWLLPIKSDLDVGEEIDCVPQGVDWLLSLLQTIHDRYSLLPQPGHRLQFLELQIELCEEMHLRLAQLIDEELHVLGSDNGRNLEGGTHLLAMLNVAYCIKQSLLDWSHSVSYLELHYYKQKFHFFTELLHSSTPDVETISQKETPTESDTSKTTLNRKESLSLSQIELDACTLAQQEANNFHPDILNYHRNIDVFSQNDLENDTNVFEKLPSLFGRLVDNACIFLCEDLVLEIKSASRDYRNQKWHYIPEVDNWQSRSLSPALCAPLGALSSRLLKLRSALVPELFTPLWRSVAKEIDTFIYEEVILECWWGPGGIQQFHYDMSRNLIPIFAQYTNSSESYLPKISESCKLLTMLKGTALLLKETIINPPINAVKKGDKTFAEVGVTHLNESDIIRVLNQRTDMNLVQ